MSSNLILLYDFDGVVITQKSLEVAAFKHLKMKIYKWKNVEHLRLIDFARIFEESDSQNKYKALRNVFRAYKPYLPSLWRRFLFFIRFRRTYQKYEKIYDTLNPELEKILLRLKERKILLGIVSNTKGKRLKYFTRKFNLNQYFSVILSRDDIPYRKPHPYGILYALKLIKKKENLIKINKDNVFFIGDLPSDIKCAENAKIKSIALTSGHGVKIDLERSNPTYLIEDINEIIHIKPLKEFLSY